MTLKRAQVVMLPTNEKVIGKILKIETFIKSKYRLSEGGNTRNTQVIKNQHLYFLRPIKSEQNPDGEEIKDGDWQYNPNTNSIEKHSKLDQKYWDDKAHGCKKIIATTDSSLKTDKVFTDKKSGVMSWASLPKPLQDFIKIYVEEYNKGNVIEWVDVEYEEMIFTNAFESDLSLTVNGLQDTVLTKLKVNSKNEITIRKIKDFWSREEVKQLCWQAFIDFKCVSGKIKPSEASELIEPFNKWISENL